MYIQMKNTQNEEKSLPLFQHTIMLLLITDSTWKREVLINIYYVKKVTMYRKASNFFTFQGDLKHCSLMDVGTNLHLFLWFHDVFSSAFPVNVMNHLKMGALMSGWIYSVMKNSEERRLWTCWSSSSLLHILGKIPFF